MRIVKLEESLRIADNVRNLMKQSSTNPLSETVVDLARVLHDTSIAWAICGGLAVGVHARPRGTDDIDVVLTDESIIPSFMERAFPKFKQTRAHAMVHRQTGVEVECITPQFVKINPEIAIKAIEQSKSSQIDGVDVPVISREGLVAMKLCRGSDYDKGDIKSILRNGDVNLDAWSLSEKEKLLFETIKQELNKETQAKENN